MTDDKIKEAYNGIDTLQAEIEIGDFIKCEIRDLRKKSIARLEAAKEQLIFVLSSGGQCPFSMSPDVHCKSVAGKCESCVEQNIEWKTERTEE